MPKPRDDRDGRRRPRAGAYGTTSGRPPSTDRGGAAAPGETGRRDSAEAVRRSAEAGRPERAAPGRAERAAPAPGSGSRGAPSDRRPARPRVIDPGLPPYVTGRELDRAVRAELRGLTPENAELVARHLVMAARLVDDDPETALAHAMAAQRRAGRIAAVREAAGVTAYLAGRYGEALSELRAARRLSGSPEHLPMMADCERGLGRPERSLELARSPQVAELEQAGRIEMRIVAAGARRDLGQNEAAVLTLALPELRTKGKAPWLARLRFAYADALVTVGRLDEARTWFALAAEADEHEVTDAGMRLAELDGVTFLGLDEAPPGEASDDLRTALTRGTGEATAEGGAQVSGR